MSVALVKHIGLSTGTFDPYKSMIEFYITNDMNAYQDNVNTGASVQLKWICEGTEFIQEDTPIYTFQNNGGLVQLWGESDFKRLARLYLNNCNLVGVINLSNWKPVVASLYLYLQDNSNLVGLVLPDRSAAANLSLNLFRSGISGTLDIRGKGVAGLHIGECSNITSVLFDKNQYLNNFYAYGVPIRGGLDFSGCSNLSIVDLRDWGISGRALSFVSFVGSSNPTHLYLTGADVENLYLNNKGENIKLVSVEYTSLGYFDLTNSDLFKENGDNVQLHNTFIAEEVNHFLVDFLALANAATGVDYATMTISIAGSNAAPDGTSGGYDGLTAKSDLQALGITVSTN